MTTAVTAIMEEIRQSRCCMSAQCGHDPSRYIEYLKQFNRKYSDQVQRYENMRRAGAESSDPAE